MQKYDAITIGFGQGAHKIARELAKQKWTVAMIEKSDEMYGGSCVNIGCIPTKLMDHDAKAGKKYEEIINRRDKVVEKDRHHNYNSMQENEFVDIYTGLGSFISNHAVKVETKEDTKELTAKYIFIDTGSIASFPPIEGLKEARHVYDSTSLQELPHLPASLGIIGAGNIGLEFASIYSTMGSNVTIFEKSDIFMGDEEPEVAKEVKQVLEDKGITVHIDAKTTKVTNEDEKVVVELSDNHSYSFDALLVATGHTPQIENLNLDKTDIQTTDSGGIKVNDYLETDVPNVFAVGDVRGKLKFTYITTDDAAIVLDYLFEKGTRKLSDRKNVPYATFIDPPFARVGITEKEAVQAEYSIMTNTVAVKSTDRADIINDHRGMYKAVVDKNTNLILGVTLFGPESHELVNMIKMAMDHRIPYTTIRDQVITHPVMTEIFQTLFTFN